MLGMVSTAVEHSGKHTGGVKIVPNPALGSSVFVSTAIRMIYIWARSLAN